MGRKLKRGKAGNVVQYLTRTNAIRKLQLKLSEFRRLCILKGIHPREPKKKSKGANKTYYHAKDINWLMHEPLLQVFRNMQVHNKKVRKAYAKFNPELAQRLRGLTPTYKLDHLVRERYPSFVDALRDLDDPLTMVHLFATLPAEKRYGIPNKAVDTARRLMLEFNAWVVRAHALRKVFVSVKGIYFQAEVLGNAVTWLVPHQLAQVLPTDVDYKVMLTFLEFYECLLQFVNFKLYHNLGLKYPPVPDPKLEEAAAGLSAVMRDLAGVRETVGQQIEEQSAALKAVPDGKKGGKKQPEATLGERIKAIAAEDKGEGQQQQQEQQQQQRQQQQQEGSDSEGSEGEGEEEDDEEYSEAGLEIDSGEDNDDDDDNDDNNDDDDDDGEDEGRQGSKAREAGAAGSSRKDGGAEDEDEGEDDDDVMGALRRSSGQAASTRKDRAGGSRDGDNDGNREGGSSGDDAAKGPFSAAGGALGADVGVGDDEAALCGALFRGAHIFLAREVPREPLALVIRAFGGVAGWDGEGSPLRETDESITHHVVDRPVQGHRFLTREYVQPQWVFDSANWRVLMPTEKYAPGQALPPHLSPFVDNEEEGYAPDFAQEIARLQEAARAARMRASGLISEDAFAEEAAAREASAGEGDAAAAAAADPAVAERQYQAELNKELRAAAKAASKGEEGDGSGGESEEDVEMDEEGGPEGKAPTAKGAAAAEDDEAAMKDIMMTRKTKKFYERVQRSQQGKRERVEELEARKRKLGAQQQQQQQQEPASGKASNKRRK